MSHRYLSGRPWSTYRVSPEVLRDSSASELQYLVESRPEQHPPEAVAIADLEPVAKRVLDAHRPTGLHHSDGPPLDAPAVEYLWDETVGQSSLGNELVFAIQKPKKQKSTE